jgi:transcriptional regulator with XRE-family HTH domain
MRNIGRRIIELRRERQWTQETAAERLRFDVVTLRRIEGGKHFVTLRTLVRVANAFGVPTRALFDEARLGEARRPGWPHVRRSRGNLTFTRPAPDQDLWNRHRRP